jgi:hypothetical protein
MLEVYAIKTDGLRYYVGDCPDEDEAVEALVQKLTKGYGNRDTVRLDLVRPSPPQPSPCEPGE